MNYLRNILVLLLSSISVFLIHAQAAPSNEVSDSVLFIIPAENSSDITIAKVDKNYTLGHFAWGIDAGSAVDLTANDMTSVNIHGYFGYKGSWVRFLGVGAGINTMISNSSRSYPIYAMFRTSFSKQPQLCFMDLRGGIAFNNILNYPSQTDPFGSIGIGITLAHSRKFSSHLIVSYDFMPIRAFTLYRTVEETAPVPGEVFDGEETTTTTTRLEPYRQTFPNLHYASIRIGCSF